MVTLGLITLTIQAEERAKCLEQNIRILAEIQRTIPSDRPTPRWRVALGNCVAYLGRKVQEQTKPTPCCVQEHSCAKI
jgi:hypothetical protein